MNVPQKSSPPFDLPWLLHPLDPALFFQQYWETKPLHLSGRSKSYYRDLYTLEDFDHTLLCGKFDPKDIFVSKLSSKVSHDLFMTLEGMVDMVKLYQFFEKGHTVYAYQIHRRNDRIRRFCRRIENELHQESFPAVFLTPPNSQGAKPHYDVPNIFVLQLEGQKTWRLYEPVGEKPFRMDDITVVDPENLGAPVLEVTLNSGDLFYFPRGYLHEPFTSGESSLHITLGFIPRVWWEVLKASTDQMLQGHPRFREALPRGWFSGEIDDKLQSEFKSLLAEFAETCDLEKIMQSFREHLLNNQQPLPDGHFRQIQNEANINLDTLLSPREDIIAHLHWDETPMAVLTFSGGKISGPPHIYPTLEEIIKRKAPFRVREVRDDLGDEGRITLVRRLVKRGFLKVLSY